MGEHEGWTRSSGLLPSGLLPNAGSVIQALDSERWLKVEERTAELIACIQPNQASEERRNAVSHYVQQLVMKCFPCQVFTFGSVPLKTYLPDGDIDLTAFSNNQGLKDTWANQVRDMLESEEKNENAEFNVKEVQYIQAEVKLIKCLVENIVVDISFNQLGGLCTLCFLDEVDHLINQNHLFKCSIILIKAWCYYESRILGAHHGLISTYALETLVLYIFHVFNNSFAGPLEVLYRFLEFFSNFDWDNYCVSLPGPVPINSLPDMTAEPPRKDRGDLLLSKLFLDGCSSVYAVFPGGQENRGQPFVSKHFNVIDPLRINNNLGRSVSKGNFFRIRSAFAFGAKRLERLLDCPKENLVYEVNQFFMNSWERHGRGNRPDAPAIDLWHSTLSTPNHHPVYESPKNNSFGKKMNENQLGHETEGEGIHSHHATSQHQSYPLESMPWTNNASVIHTQNQKGYGNSNSLKASDQTVREGNSGQVPHADKAQRNLKSDNLLNDIKGRFLFVRTRSSPELTNTYNEVSSQGRRNRALETGENQSTSARVSNNWKRSMGSEISGSRGGQPLIDDLSSIRHSPAQQSFGAFVPSNIGSNSYNHDPGSGAMSNEHSSTFGTQGMLQEEQDLVNIMASSMVHCFNGQVQVPLNLASTLPLPISSSVLASMGYNQRNLAGMSPLNIPLIDPFVQMQFPNGLLSPSLAQYFPGIGLTSNLEDSFEHGNENFGSVEMNPGEVDHDFWQEQNVVSTRGFDPDKHNFDTFQADEKPQSTSTGFNYVHSFQESSSSPSSTRGQQKYAKDRRGLMWEDCSENLDYEDSRGNEVNSEERMVSSRFSSASHSSSLRSKTSSESSWEGSSAKGSKAMRERRGTKTVSVEPSTGYGKGKSMIEHMPSMQTEEEGAEWNAPLNIGTENADRSSMPQPITSMHVPRHHITGYEQAQPSGSDSMIPIAPVILGPGSKQRMMDNSGVFTFYPTGPPVPFLTMLPIYNIPSDTRTSNVAADEGVENSDSGQNFEPSEGLDQSEELSSSNSLTGAIPIKSSDKSKPDILNSDFASHWQNLQYGRFCQNPRYNGPMVYPSPVMVPPVYLQGRIPSDGHGRPPVNANVFTQLMSYGPRIVPVTPVQSVANRPPSSFQRFVDDIPRYRSGTGTYLPNPRISARERHSPGTRKGNYNYDRSDSHGDREGNWNMNSKSRATGRNHSRSQTDKSSSRLDRLSESRAERSWSSYRQESFPSYHSQNGSLRSSSIQSGHPNLAYSMYPIPAMNSNEASSNEPIAPSVMLYPFEHNTNYDPHAEQLEFGSIGPLGFTGSSEILQLGEGTRPRGAFEDQRHLGSSIRQSSPDQPSSPQHQRRI